MKKLDAVGFQLVFEDGYIYVPQKPGLGLELDEEKLRKLIESQ